VSSSPGGGTVVRVEARGKNDREVFAQLDLLLENPPDALWRALVVDTVEGLSSHDLLFERIGASRQVEAMLVVAVGSLGLDSALVVPATLQREGGPVVLWVGDPVGSRWQLGAVTASRLPTSVPEEALERLLGVLEVPEIFRAVVHQPSPMVVSPGLSLWDGDGDSGLSSDDEDVFLPALSRALNRLQKGDEEPEPDAERLGRGQCAVRQVLEALCPAVDAPGVLPKLVPEGQLAAGTGSVRDGVTELTTQVQRLLRPFSVRAGGEAVRRVGDAASAVAETLLAYRDLCAQLPDGVQAPGGGVRAAAIEQRCRQYGLRLQPGDQPAPSPGRIVGAQVSSWIGEGASLSEIDTRLQQLERGLGPTSPRQYREQVLQACPDALLERLRTPAPFPAVTLCLLLSGLAVGLLAGFARTGLVPGWIAVLSGVTALVGSVLVLWASWHRRCVEWVDQLGIEEIREAQRGLNACVGSLVSEWSALGPRVEAIDTVILARSLTAVLRAAMAPVLAHLEKRSPGALAGPQGAYWSTAVDEQVRAVVAETLDPVWERVVHYQLEAMQRRLQDDLARALIAWIDESGNWAARALRSATSGADTPRLPPETVDAVVSASSIDVTASMWQLAHPDDLSLLVSRPQDVAAVRFAPTFLEQAVSGRCRYPVLPVVGLAAAGVLRLVPLREGIVTLRWPVSVQPSGPANALPGSAPTGDPR
jgi:hypothetical protein